MTGRSKWLRLLAIIGVAVIGLAACDSEEQTAEDQSVDAAGDDTGDDPAAQGETDDGATDDPYGGGGDTDSGAKDEKPDDAAGASGGPLEIEGFAFTDTQAAPGATVKVENKDSTAHTVTGDNDEFDTGEIDGDGTGEFTAPAEPGEYAFHCEIHTSMKGTLTVA